ncbi:PR domain zinc finger protein 8 [Coregonus clupeaformis]|uniref:PR domain zinc finger protein 8 n=1 Tax=Coregonus clupeaformis TaxID=59861 RepID=UPI001E1C4D6F|nr:PR domain zinc finger protein 8 [Coregonus clupeaformis]
METLEADILAKLFWNTEAEARQRWITEIFTRVHTTCDVPENAVFGPYELKHTSVYDSVAFIALKSMDRRTAPYILRVDTSAPNMRTDGPMWLRLVQSARSAEEQNLEAYVKNGQLFFRALRTILKEEELLVWYGKDLAKLLLLNPLQIQSKGAGLYTCANCNQGFETEFPFLAHRRFLCTQRQPNSHTTKPGQGNTDHVKPDSLPVSAFKRSRPETSPQDNKPATDFHNLARDMENIKTGSSSTRDTETIGSLKRKHTKVEEDRWSEPQPLVIKQEPLDRGCCTLNMKIQPSSVSCHLPSNINKNNITKDRATQLHIQQGSGPEDLRSSSSLRSSSPSLIWSSFTDSPTVTSAFIQVSVSENRRSAFSQPPRSVSLPQTTPLLGRAKTSITPLTTDLHRPVLVQGVLKQRHPLYSQAALWPRTPGRSPLQVQISLPPSVSRLSPLSLMAQNLCAKCNISFRLISDLVQHMRSYHKRALDTTESGSGVKQQQRRAIEERLKCSVCSEVFRQRHHLARHMTSHT